MYLEDKKAERVRIFYQLSPEDKSLTGELDIEFLNPTELSGSTRVNISEHDIRRETNKQYIETHREQFTVSLRVDSTSELNIRELHAKKKVDRMRALLMPTIKGYEYKKPPLCRFVWGAFEFVGYVSSIEERYVQFDSSGYPVRANVTLTLLPYSSEEKSDVYSSVSNSRKFRTVKSGDRLDLIASQMYGDPSLWYIIAEENDIENPMNFPSVEDVGNRLIIPDLMQNQ